MSGSITFLTSAGTGKLDLEHGRVTAARLGPATGRPALRRLVRLTQGLFLFRYKRTDNGANDGPDNRAKDRKPGPATAWHRSNVVPMPTPQR